MLWFKQFSSPMEFRLVVTEDVTRPHEYPLVARSEREALERASDLTRRLCENSGSAMSAFLLDAQGVFLADLGPPQITSDITN